MPRHNYAVNQANATIETTMISNAKTILVSAPTNVRTMVILGGVLLSGILAIIWNEVSLSQLEKFVWLVIYATGVYLIWAKYIDYQIIFNHNDKLICFNKSKFRIKCIRGSDVTSWGLMKSGLKFGHYVTFYCALRHSNKRFEYELLMPMNMNSVILYFKQIIPVSPEKIEI